MSDHSVLKLTTPRILVTGQCSVHWGRLEFGNIGNYYITRTLFRELRRVYPGAEVSTTFQMTDAFAEREDINVLPLSLFYNWRENEVELAQRELEYAEGQLAGSPTTPFIEVVIASDLVIDFSGEMWGDHAEAVGADRFHVGLLKMLTAQALQVPTVLLAGSQGPFDEVSNLDLAKRVFAGYDLVLNRESESVRLLAASGFDTRRVESFTDPAFLFQSEIAQSRQLQLAKLLHSDGHTPAERRPRIGFILCGFNMSTGPYDRWPRPNDEFTPFVELVRHMFEDLHSDVFVMSHQNGFTTEPAFELVQGRDAPYAEKLAALSRTRIPKYAQNIHLLEGPYSPDETKFLLGQMDIVVSGRIHGFVAATSQGIPSVVIDRNFLGPSHRNFGFAKSIGLESFVARPDSIDDMVEKVTRCFYEREHLQSEMLSRLPSVKQLAHECFDRLLSVTPAVNEGNQE